MSAKQKGGGGTLFGCLGSVHFNHTSKFRVLTKKHERREGKLANDGLLNGSVYDTEEPVQTV